MENYLNEIKAYPKLNKKQEQTLFYMYYTGNTMAYTQLISSNLLNSYNLAYKFYNLNQAVPLDEMVAEANECLINCVKQYDATRDLRFFSYLATAIRNRLVKLLNLHQNISLPQHLMSIFSLLDRNKITFDELIPKRKLEYDLYAHHLYIRFTDEDNKFFGFDIEDIDIIKMLTQEEMEIDIDILLKKVKIVERYIIINYYGLKGKKKRLLKDIASDLCISSTLASTYKEYGLNKMKQYIQKSKI